jgi:hypothetical protein
MKTRRLEMSSSEIVLMGVAVANSRQKKARPGAGALRMREEKLKS